jgi:hypothetical protein
MTTPTKSASAPRRTSDGSLIGSPIASRGTAASQQKNTSRA